MALEPIPRSSSEEIELSPLRIVSVLVRHRRVLYTLAPVFVALGIVYSLLAAPVFEAHGTLIPIWEQESQLSRLARMAGAMAPVPQSSNLSYYLPDILESRSFALETLAQRFQTEAMGEVTLSEYLTADMEPRRGHEDSPGVRQLWAVKALERMTDVDMAPQTGIIALSISAPEPALAADVTNRMLDLLNPFLTTMVQAEHGEARLFIEGRLSAVGDQLRGAEGRLQAFRDQNRQISNSPQLMLEEERLIREVTLQEGVYLELSRQLEVEKINEVRSAPGVRILDWATPPLQRAFPKRKLLVLLFAVASILAWVLVAFAREYYLGLKKTANGEVDGILDALRQDIAVLPVVGSLARIGGRRAS